jgi:hypothetical protein
MSSGPVGLDAREYSYDQVSHTVVGAGTNLSTLGQWLVTRIQVYNDVDPMIVQLIQPSGFAANTTIVEASGCLELEPNGAFRGEIQLLGGLGALIVVEYWFQAQQDGAPPNVVIT